MPYDESHFESVRQEVRRHLEDTETSKLAHWGAAAVYERTHKLFIGLPALLLSLLLTWLLSSDTKAFLSADDGWKSFANSLPVVLSLVVSVLSGLGAFLNLNDLAGKHRTAAENLHALWRDCRNWDTDYPDASMCEKAVQTVQTYRQRLNEINRDSPQIPKWAWKSVRPQRLEGSTQYESDKNA
ncbi:SLATT domain-containing protein [Ramlibacter tataouinensis]|uniref:SLATT domain-containing protein n=1 Tax=Ramlibacter tataouinensis TaxID=94132 RepID=UPI00117FEA1A